MFESRKKTIKRIQETIKDIQTLRSKIENGQITPAEVAKEAQRIADKITKINSCAKHFVEENKALEGVDFGQCILDSDGEYNRCTTRNCEKCERFKIKKQEGKWTK